MAVLSFFPCIVVMALTLPRSIQLSLVCSACLFEACDGNGADIQAQFVSK
jgi:hypothetical protein